MVAQRSYAQKYEEQKKKEKETSKKKNIRSPKERINPYMKPAIYVSIAAFILSIFPWPSSWGIGTSLWMRIIILLIALLGIYHCIKANQIDNWNNKHVSVYQKRLALSVANVLSVATAMIAALSLFMS